MGKAGSLETLLVEYSKLLYNRGYVSSKNGNMTAVTDRGTVLWVQVARTLNYFSG